MSDKEKEEKHMMNVLAKPVNQAFVLDPAKAEEFFKRKANPIFKKRALRRSELLRQQRERSKHKND